jgi:hypothetical protein
MDNEADWVFVEDNIELVVELTTTSICDETDEENSDKKNKSSYVGALLKNVQKNHQQQQPVLSIVQKKEKPIIKQDNERELMTSYIEPKPGSQYRNPRDKAGQNKVHRHRERSTDPPKKAGNSLKIGCSFCNPKVANRAESRRTLRQQRSITNWKDYDH